MGKNDFIFASKVVELSEEKDYLTLKNRVCFFNSENLNGVQLDYNDDTQEQIQSLINTPLVAKYIKRNGKDDLGGHELKLVNGQYEFQTQAVGVNTEVEIVEEEVELVDGSTAKLPCLYCTEILWTRFKNVAKAVKRLFAEGKLHNSWELKSSEYTYKDGIKHITKYTFIGNCLLGTASYPAYGKSAEITEMSEKTEFEYMAAEAIGEALEMDIASMPASNIQQTEEGGTPEMEVNENVVVEAEAKEDTVEEAEIEVEATEETAESEEQQAEGEVTSANNEAEVSEGDSEQEESEADESEDAKETSTSLTINDIRKMLIIAVEELCAEGEWRYVSMIFPEEHIVLVQSWRMKELQFEKYSYQIEGDKAVLGEREDVELTISPLQINSEIQAKNNAIAEANIRINELESQVSELTKAKEELDQIKSAKAEEEHAEAVNKLRKYVEESKQFSAKELQSEEVNNAIESLNENWIKAEIADRLVKSFASKKTETSESHKEEVSFVLSENHDKSATSEDVMRAFFND